METENVYSLACSYYKKQFSSIDLLIEDIIATGMDPSYEITKNGKSIGEEATDFITY